MYDRVLARKLAQEGPRDIQNAILNVLDSAPQGMKNAEIADLPGRRSSIRGRQKNSLTYSVLGTLMEGGRVKQDKAKRWILLP